MRIHVKDLKLELIIGAFDWERETKHSVTLNIKYDYDATNAAKTDNLEHAMNYHGLLVDLIAKVKTSQFHLIETLAAFILDELFAHAPIQWAEVEIDKWATGNPRPYPVDHVRSVSVTHARSRA